MEISWDAENVLSAVLVGRTIVSTQTVPDGEYGDDLVFTLDDGTVLRANSRHGGCACSNGCFSVDSPSPVGGRIMSVQAVDPSDGESAYGTDALRIFVYTDLGVETLIVSEGTDNGYYGWGFTFTITGVEEGSNG